MEKKPYSEKTINEFNKRIDALKKLDITLDKKLTPDKKLRGIYGFFAVDENDDETCFYVGKANDIFLRMIGKSNAHFTFYLQWLKHGKKDSKKLTDVHRKISLFLDAAYSIEVRVLQEVPYDYSQSFELNANRLSLAELSELVDHQINGECAEQLSENVKKNEKNTFEYYYPYALISHIKDFGYWYSCVLQYKDTLFSDSYMYDFPDAELIRECDGFNIYKHKNETDDELTLYLYGRMGGLLYEDMCNPKLNDLPAYAKAYMIDHYDQYEIKVRDLADSSVAYKALEEFLEGKGLKITSCSVCENDCYIYHINKKELEK